MAADSLAPASPAPLTLVSVAPLGDEVEFFDVTAADGTLLRGWSNDLADTKGWPTVVLCNGLGTNPWCWPALLAPDAGVRVVSWFHRGTGGSAVPADHDATGIEEFSADAIAVMDHLGIASAPLMGWSMGVNTAFEVAVTHPHRVTGLFAVAGVPGGTFATMLRPLHLPMAINQAVTVNLSRVMRTLGPVLSPIARNLPFGDKSMQAVSHSGFMLPVADVEMSAFALKEFLTTPIDWYFHMALRTHLHNRVSLSKIGVPAVFIAGHWDVLAGAADMKSAAERMSDAVFVEFPNSHFLPMERPAEVHALLLELLERV